MIFGLFPGEHYMNTRRVRISILTLRLMAGSVLVPALAFAAEEGNKWGPWLEIGKVFNLLLVVAVLVWAARKPLSNFFASRSHAIREQLAEAQKAREEAEAKLAEMGSRMSRLDDEIREIKLTAEKEAKEEYQRLLSAAEQDAGKIIERSRQEIEGITRTAQQELKIHVAELSVKMAEEKIRGEITDADRGRIFSRFVTKLGGPK
jgi:F-type H+-transporting ATPase subunit b